MKKPGPIRRKVNSPRNSICAFRMDWLDWSAWWTDCSFGGLYLHVRGFYPDEPRTPENATWHRVYARGTDSPRLRFENGVLYWLIDAPDKGEETAQ